MPGPLLYDDGNSVTLDLHGLRIDEALRMAQALVREAARRGRSTVKFIHGASTSSTLFRNRTIKHELEDMLDSSTLKPLIASIWKDEGHLLVGLSTNAPVDPTRIQLAEIFR